MRPSFAFHFLFLALTYNGRVHAEPKLEARDANGPTGLAVMSVDLFTLTVRSAQGFYGQVSPSGRIGRSASTQYPYKASDCTGERYLELDSESYGLFPAVMVSGSSHPYFVPADGGYLQLDPGNYFTVPYGFTSCNQIALTAQTRVQRQSPNDPSVTGIPNVLAPPIQVADRSVTSPACVFADSFECAAKN